MAGLPDEAFDEMLRRGALLFGNEFASPLHAGLSARLDGSSFASSSSSSSCTNGPTGFDGFGSARGVCNGNEGVAWRFRVLESRDGAESPFLFIISKGMLDTRKSHHMRTHPATLLVDPFCTSLGAGLEIEGRPMTLFGSNWGSSILNLS